MKEKETIKIDIDIDKLNFYQSISQDEYKKFLNKCKTTCKGCMNENFNCKEMQIIDCWLHHTYLTRGEANVAMCHDTINEMTSTLSESLNKRILDDMKQKGLINKFK